MATTDASKTHRGPALRAPIDLAASRGASRRPGLGAVAPRAFAGWMWGACRLRQAAGLILLGLALGAGPAWAGAQDRFAEGRAHYASEDYEAAVAAFERAVAARSEVSEYHHWLGKAYGRLAETSSWYRALRLAPKAREAFEQAVRIDDANVPALIDLLEYYRNAPAFLGGSEDKARQIRERLEALGALPNDPSDG